MNTRHLLHRNVMKAFPKVELHRHIEGSFCLTTLFNIAQRNKIKNAADNLQDFIQEVQFPKGHPPDFKMFLSKFRNDWYRSYEDVYELVYNSVLRFKKENLFFIELRFSPEHFAWYSNLDRIEVTKIILHAAGKAAKEIDVYIKFLITFNRNKQSQEEMLSLYNIIVQEGFSDIIGCDLAGDEIINPPEEFMDLFNKVHADGMGITVHAGEVTDAGQIWSAIEKLHAKRIGHGTKCVEDPQLIEELITKEIVLEQCPVSNSFTNSWEEDIALHPFGRLNKEGVLVTLNSDDPTIQDTTLVDDFMVALKHYDIDYQGLVDLNIRSIKKSFMSSKEQMIAGYKEAIKKFEKEVPKHLSKTQKEENA